MIKKLALCIPAYNAAQYLPRLLTSAKNQKIPFDEILVYNDCSTDNTAEIAEAYGAMVINGDTNRGCSYGKNKLAEICESDWVHFHDADDDILPNFTTLAHKWMNTPQCPDVVLFDYNYVAYETKKLISTRRFNSYQLSKDPLEYAIKEQINPFCGLYKKNSFLSAGGYDTDPKVLYNEDCAMHIKIAISGLSFSSESEVSIINFKIDNSMSQGNYKKCLIAQYEVYRKTRATLFNLGLLSKYKKVLNLKLWNIAKILLSLNEVDYAKQAVNIMFTHPESRNATFFQKIIIKLNTAYLIMNEYRICTFKPNLRN